MSKRFTETTKWSDKWFAALNTEHKLFWTYLCDTCDQAGVWDEPHDQARARLGIKDFNFENALSIFEIGDRVRVLDNGPWWLVKFIDFQNPRGLSEGANYHKGIFASIAKNAIPFSSLSQDLTYSKSRDQDKDKDKDSSLCSDFEIFWKAYPKKSGKLAAKAEWLKAKPPLAECLKAVEAQKRSQKWIDGYILDPERWIKRGHWMNEEGQALQAKRRNVL